MGCGKLGQYICRTCEVGLWEVEQICPGCGRDSFDGQSHSSCNSYSKLDGLVGFWANDGLVHKVFAKVKQRYIYDCLVGLLEPVPELVRRPEYARFLRFIEEHKPTLVPVPLHPKRLAELGFNPAKIICDALAGQLDLPTASLLVRRRETQPLKGKSRVSHLNLLQNAIVSSKKVPPALVVVDDLWTTGATLMTCAQELKKVGAKKLWGLVLAR